MNFLEQLLNNIKDGVGRMNETNVAGPIIGISFLIALVVVIVKPSFLMHHERPPKKRKQ